MSIILLLDKFTKSNEISFCEQKIQSDIRLGIWIVGIGIDAISEEIISFPEGECMKWSLEITFSDY